MENAMCSLRCERIVRHHQHGLLVFRRKLLEQIKNFVGTLTVKIPGGFIAQQERRVCDDRARDSYSLFLSTGELARIVMHTIGKTYERHREFDMLATLRLG
jgi:hypothetical protein